MVTKSYIDELSYKIIGAAIEVHKVLGLGLLESVYEKCLVHELKLRGLKAVSQQSVMINYKGLELEGDLRFDILVEDLVVVELKAVDEMNSIFEAITLTYMKLLQIPKGLLFNFHCENITKTMKTFVNDYYGILPD